MPNPEEIVGLPPKKDIPLTDIQKLEAQVKALTNEINYLQHFISLMEPRYFDLVDAMNTETVILASKVTQKAKEDAMFRTGKIRDEIRKKFNVSLLEHKMCIDNNDTRLKGLSIKYINETENVDKSVQQEEDRKAAYCRC